MKKYLFIISIVLQTLAGCQTESIPENNYSNCFEVSIVASLCGTGIFQIKDPAFFHYGENTPTYKNTFMASIPCTPNYQNLNPDQTKLFVQVSSEPFPDNGSDCVRCAAVPSYDGKKSYHIKFVTSCDTEKLN